MGIKKYTKGFERTGEWAPKALIWTLGLKLAALFWGIVEPLAIGTSWWMWDSKGRNWAWELSFSLAKLSASSASKMWASHVTKSCHCRRHRPPPSLPHQWHRPPPCCSQGGLYPLNCAQNTPMLKWLHQRLGHSIIRKVTNTVPPITWKLWFIGEIWRLGFKCVY